MNLWIRSQDKTTLIRSYEIYISEQTNTYLIRAKRTSHILGSYSTIERALEVLDEIQSLLQPTIEYKPIVQEEYNPAYTYKHFVKVDDNIEIKELSTFVYEMPEN